MNIEESKANKSKLNQYLTFILDNEEYGVPILTVMGIQGWEKTTPIPDSPDFVKGIINLRGEVVPIIDLRKRFDLEEVPYNTHTVVIVVSIGLSNSQRTVGLVVDAVADVHNLNEEDMRATPEFGETASNDFIKGLGLIDGKMVIILEIDQLVDWEKIPNENREIHASEIVNGASTEAKAAQCGENGSRETSI